MLRLFIGRAGSGKTSAVMREVGEEVRLKRGGNIIIVPDQFSFEAERELLLSCGNTASLYAEIIGFSALKDKLTERIGSDFGNYVDRAGRLISLACAVGELGSELKLFGGALSMPQILSSILDTLGEFKNAGISPEDFEKIESGLDPERETELKTKLKDLRLISEKYNEILERGGKKDPLDTQEYIASKISALPAKSFKNVYIDGFLHFSGAQLKIVFELMKKAEKLTISLGTEDENNGSEAHALASRLLRRLKAYAEENNIKYEIKRFDEDEEKKELSELIEKAMGLEHIKNEGEFSALGGKIRLYSADSKLTECSLAAAEVKRLVRDGERYRDIAIAVRGYESYRPLLESVFKKYELPLFSARKAEMEEMPLFRLLELIYETILSNFSFEEFFRYLRLGYSGLTDSEIDRLQNYCIMWDIGGRSLLRKSPWKMHPEGFGGEESDESNKKLEELNSCRDRAVAPLRALSDSAKKTKTAGEHCSALRGFFKSISLGERLSERATELKDRGLLSEAAEFKRLWSQLMLALSQIEELLKDAEMDTAAFSKLLLIALSEYPVGILPVSLDSPMAGDFDRMRRRNLRHLIVLGASEERLPQKNADEGLIRDRERERLGELGFELPGGENELYEEYARIYSTLTLPSESLVMCYGAGDEESEEPVPSEIFSRIEKLTGAKEIVPKPSELALFARKPALSLASETLFFTDEPNSVAARAYFEKYEPEEVSRLKAAAESNDLEISRETVIKLYGDKLRLSPSQADTFYDCKYKHFLRHSLRLKPDGKEEFGKFEYGSFIHDVVENTVKELKKKDTLKICADDEIIEIAGKYADRYGESNLKEQLELSYRFSYIFARAKEQSKRITTDIISELRVSSFEPIGFEFDIGELARKMPIDLSEGAKLFLSGKADRIDGWIHEEKLYLRVYDYKTGNVKFSLEEVLYGRYLQMLIYLFVLSKGGVEVFKSEVEPAGVLYLPARDVIISAKSDLEDDELEAQKSKALQRSGLLLDNSKVLEAMEKQEPLVFLPISEIEGSKKSDLKSLASAEELKQLSEYIIELLKEFAETLLRGEIEPEPYFRNQNLNACTYCDFKEACNFKDGETGSFRRFSAVEGGSLREKLSLLMAEKVKGGEQSE